jgi:hypothetical protein
MVNPLFLVIWGLFIAILSFRAGMEWQKNKDDDYRKRCDQYRYQM